MAAMPAQSETEAQLVYSDEDYGVALAGHNIVVYWKGRTTTAAVEQLTELLLSTRLKFGTLGLLQVIGDEAVPPDSAARAELASMLKANENFIVASAVVFEAVGFRASMIRSIFIGISMLSRTKYPHVVFASVSEGIDWLSGHFGDAAPQYARSLRAAVSTLKAAMSSRQRAHA